MVTGRSTADMPEIITDPLVVHSDQLAEKGGQLLLVKQAEALTGYAAVKAEDVNFIPVHCIITHTADSQVAHLHQHTGAERTKTCG